MFELTGRQWLTVKRGIRNVGQFLTAEVTNPGQNESQQMFAFCDRMDKEGDILDRDSSPNESPDRVKDEERGRMIGQNPKAEVAPFSSVEIRMKKRVLERRSPWTDRRISCQTLGEEAEPGFRTTVGVTGYIETVAEIPGKKRKESWTRRNLQAKLHKILLARKRENTLRRNPSKS